MKKILYILPLIYILAACSDEVAIKDDVFNQNDDNALTISLSVPGFEIIPTRGEVDEDAINSLDFFLFDNSGSSRHISIPKGELTGGGNTFSYKFMFLNNEERSGDNRVIAVVANGNNLFATSELTDDGISLSNLRSKLIESLPVSDIVMYGEKQLTSSNLSDNRVTIDLKRTVGKVTMEISDDIRDFTLSGFQIVNASSKAYLNGISSEDSGSSTDVTGFYIENPTAITADSDSHTYIFPTKGVAPASSVPNKWQQSYIVLQGDYKGENCYYRIDLIDKNDKPVDFLANKWYQIEITYVGHKGFSSPEEAAVNPETSDFEYIIHDHVPSIYSMTTDGVRELATVETLVMNSSSLDFIVKCYSVLDEGKTTGKESDVIPSVEVEEGSWLKVITPTISVSDVESSDSHDNPGVQWQFSLETTHEIYSDEEAVLKVTWQGLTRRIRVIYDATFDAKAACSVTLTIHNNDDNVDKTIMRYWYFIAGMGKKIIDENTGEYTDTDAMPRLFGISTYDHTNKTQSNSMADGKVRNEGLHFPMPYGKTNNWTYDYSINFGWDDIVESGFNNIEDVSVDIQGTYFRQHIKPSVSGNVVTLEWIGNNDYSYETGSAKFNLRLASGEEIEMSVALYHTGFFHYDTSSTTESDKGYYYYEVVPMGNSYWLDRNLGAKSNKMYVRHVLTTDVGESMASGRLYTIADPGIDYGDPNLNDERFCPPGYHIPTTTDWDGIRLSSNFKNERTTESGQSFISSFYRSESPEAGNIYFPKSRYYNKGADTDQNVQPSTFLNSDKANSGDDAAGYYWSRSVAYGLEKEQIGQWLRALNMSGTSNTFINGNIPDHKMNVRCIAGQKPATETENKYSINFNVKGATHVYLYTEANGNKSGVFTFPGKAIGSQSAVDNLDYNDDFSYLQFAYTGTIESGNLKVFFTYVTDDGNIIILSANNATTLEAAEGWDVKVGYNYFFSGSGKTQMDSRGVFKNPESEGSAECYFKKGKDITIYWPTAIDNIKMYKIYMFYQNGAKDNEIGDFPGKTNLYTDNSPFGTGEAYYFTFTLDYDCDEITVILSNKNDGVNGDQTTDILINSSSSYCQIGIDNTGNYNVNLLNPHKK